MDFSIDPVERSQLDPHCYQPVYYIDKPIQKPPNFGSVMKLHLKQNNLTFSTRLGPVSIQTIFPDTMDVHIDVSQP